MAWDAPEQEATGAGLPRSLGYAFLFVASSLPTFHDNLISITDVVLIFLLPVTFSRVRGNRVATVVISLIGLWLVVQCISDYYHHLFPRHLGGAIVEPVLLLATVSAGIYVADLWPQRWVTVVRVVLASDFAYYFLFVNPGFSYDSWKYGIGLPSTLLAISYLGILWERGRHGVVILFLLPIASVSFLVGYRNLGFDVLLAAVLLWLLRSGAVGKRRAGLGTLVYRIVAIVLALLLTSSAYASLARSGRLGRIQAAKFVGETSAGQFALLAARPEIFASAATIYEYPLLGLGSRGQFDAKVVGNALTLATANHTRLNINEQRRIFTQDNGLNSHSLLFNAWTRGGLLAAPPLVAFMYLCLASCFGRIRIPARHQPLVVTWSVVTAWDLLFSPWSAHYQLGLGLLIGLLCVSYGRSGAEQRSP